MKRKRYLALIGAVLMVVFLFTGCASQNDSALLGKWQLQLDMTQWVRSVIGENTEYGDYAELITKPDMGVGLTCEFQPKGKAVITLELDSLTELINALEKVAPAAFENILQEAGYGDLIPVLEMLLSKMDEGSDAGRITVKIRYKTQNGKLRLSFSGIAALLGAADLDYQVQDGTLMLTAASTEQTELEELFDLILPLELEKCE